ncbi:MAG: hypothetical protein U1E30_04620 [Rhodoblastus sp.]
MLVLAAREHEFFEDLHRRGAGLAAGNEGLFAPGPGGDRQGHALQVLGQSLARPPGILRGFRHSRQQAGTSRGSEAEGGRLRYEQFADMKTRGVVHRS